MHRNRGRSGNGPPFSFAAELPVVYYADNTAGRIGMRNRCILGSARALAACGMLGRGAGKRRRGGPAARSAISRSAASMGRARRVARRRRHGRRRRLRSAPRATPRLDRLEIKVENGELRIGTQKRTTGSAGIKRRRGHRLCHRAGAQRAPPIGRLGRHADRQGRRRNASRPRSRGSGDSRSRAARSAGAISRSPARATSAAGRGRAKPSVSIAGSGDIDLAGVADRATPMSRSPARATSQAAGQPRRRDVSIMGSGNVTIAGGASCTRHQDAARATSTAAPDASRLLID